MGQMVIEWNRERAVVSERDREREREIIRKNERRWHPFVFDPILFKSSNAGSSPL